MIISSKQNWQARYSWLWLICSWLWLIYSWCRRQIPAPLIDHYAPHWWPHAHLFPTGIEKVITLFDKPKCLQRAHASANPLHQDNFHSSQSLRLRLFIKWKWTSCHYSAGMAFIHYVTHQSRLYRNAVLVYTSYSQGHTSVRTFNCALRVWRWQFQIWYAISAPAPSAILMVPQNCFNRRPTASLLAEIVHSQIIAF